MPSVSRYPALSAAAFFLLGIACYNRLPVWIAAWLAAIVAAMLLAIVLRRRAFLSTLVLCLGWGIAGVLAAQLGAFQYRSDDIGLYASDESRLAQVELSLDDPPRVLTNPFDHRRATPPKQVAIARVTRIKAGGDWRPASGEVLLQISNPNPNLAAGQLVRATGMLQRPAPAQNPGQFDWAAYYRDRRVIASFSVGHASSISVLADPGPNLWTAAQIRARALLADGFPADRALDHALLRALLLGDNDPQLRDVQDAFQRTGTAHHLAISGTHIAVLGGILWLIFRVIGLRPRIAAAVVLIFVVGYGALALPSPPVVRSVVLAGTFCFAIMLGRVGKGLQLLAVSVVAMLVYHPQDLFNAGFQLSFGTVLGLILFARQTLYAMELAVTDRHDPDMIVARSFQPPSTRQRIVQRAHSAILEALATGFVAWLVSMPLIAYHFEQLNPWAILAGILLAPIVFIALVGGMLKLILTLLWPWQASWWAWLATWPIVGMRRTVEWLATWKWADIPVPPSPWWLIAFFYGLLLLGLVEKLPHWSRWMLRIGRLIVLVFIVLPPLQATVNPPTPAGVTRVTLLSVGAGQCAVVQPPGGRTVLLDAGSSSLADLVGKCVGPFLRHARCTGVDTIILSHADFDHVSATTELVKSYEVREVLMGPRFVEKENPQSQQLVEDLEKLERPPRLLLPGQRNPFGKDTNIEVLWPPQPERDAKEASNNGCLVLRLTHGGKSILFPGDIQDGAMRELLKHPEQLKSDVLVAMHHGSAESLTQQFIDAVDPKWIVSSNDRSLTNKQRKFETLTGGRSLLRTNECGAITITMDAEGNLSVEPFVKRAGG